MANVMQLAKVFQPVLDEVYKVGSLTSILDAPAEYVKSTMNGNEVLIPKISLDGLGTYDRANGFTDGSASFSWVTHTFTQDRGRSFNIDAQDDEESLNLAIASVTGQFIRTKVVPEIDAYRFATLVANKGAGTTGTLTKDTALQAIDDGRLAMQEAEVTDFSQVVTFVSPTIYKFLKQSNLITRSFVGTVGSTQINREIEVLDLSPVIVVPQNRFYSAITVYDGKTAGQEAGGYIKTAVTGKDINFLLVDVNSALGITKTALPRLFSPEVNQKANAYKFDYRIYHDLFVTDNKKPGIYAHTLA